MMKGGGIKRTRRSSRMLRTVRTIGLKSFGVAGWRHVGQEFCWTSHMSRFARENMCSQGSWTPSTMGCLDMVSNKSLWMSAILAYSYTCSSSLCSSDPHPTQRSLLLTSISCNRFGFRRSRSFSFKDGFQSGESCAVQVGGPIGPVLCVFQARIEPERRRCSLLEIKC